MKEFSQSYLKLFLNRKITVYFHDKHRSTVKGILKSVTTNQCGPGPEQLFLFVVETEKKTFTGREIHMIAVKDVNSIETCDHYDHYGQ